MTPHVMAPEARQAFGTLLVAWTFVTGLTAVFASAWYYRTGDLKVLIAYLGAPFAIGTFLFIMLGAYTLATRTKRRVPAEPMHDARSRHESIFRR